MKFHLILALLVAMLLQCSLVNTQIDYGTLQLMNSLTDESILNITDGATYNLNVAGDSLNIVAVPPAGASIGSVQFLTSINENRTESVAPSAQEVEANGIELGKMDRLLLKKI